MPKILFSDKASTTMSGTLASGLGTLNVAPGGGARFPAPTGGDFFYATLYQKDVGGAEINIEVVKITAKPSADSFTISQRDVTNITGYGGGYAYPGAAGTVYVELRWLEKAATAMMQAADMTAGNVRFTPAGNVIASNLQAAVQELDIEKAPLDSPALTGTPTAPTAGAGNSTTQLATTAFVSSAIGVHNGVASAHGVTGNVVGTTDAQTLTNKTIVAASNTITTAASGNLTSTNLNAALAELQGDIDTRATSSSLSSHTGATSAHGVAGNVVGTTDTQTLQNKTLDSTNTFNGNVSGASGHLAGFRNKIINGGFAVNQRAYSSGAAVGAGLYGHDRWKMAASGDTYTFSTTANKTTVTIPAGKVLQQVIEGLNLQTGTYTLSWEGTAQGKIGAGSYGASGITSSITGGFNVLIEFGPGTVANVQLEAGSIATPFEHRPYGLELALCQRYLPALNSSSTSDYFSIGQSNATNNGYGHFDFLVTPRIPPTGITVSNPAHFTVVNPAGVTMSGTSVTFSTAGYKQCRFAVVGAGGLTIGQPCEIYFNDISGKILFTGCEL